MTSEGATFPNSSTVPALGWEGAVSRRMFNSLIETLVVRGDRDGARAVAEVAVGHGYWSRIDQRPIHYYPDLLARPLYDRSDFALVAYLERHADVIMAETRSLGGERNQGFLPVEENLLASGVWNVAAFYEDGTRNEQVCGRFPQTAAIIDEGPEDIRKAGVVTLSWLAPGTKLLPHCGLTNARLRLHLALAGTEGASMRVSDRVTTWTESRCIVFDDSFEHEVWHHGERARLVLLVDFFHPGLGDAQRTDFIRRFNLDPARKVRNLLRGIAAESLAVEHDSMRVRFSLEQDRRLRRLMTEADLSRIEIEAV